MSTKTAILRDIRRAQDQVDSLNASLTNLRRQREAVEVLIAEIRARQGEFIGQIGTAQAKIVSLGHLEVDVQVSKGYRSTMSDAVLGWQKSRALSNIDTMLRYAEQRLAQIDSQMAQARSSLLQTQSRINSLNRQYRTCDED